MNDLKKCPFCGGEATIQPEGDYHEIHCVDCGIELDRHTYEEAVTAWNTRAKTEAEKKIEAVRNECEKAITDACRALDGSDFCDDFPEGRMKACMGILRILEGKK